MEFIFPCLQDRWVQYLLADNQVLETRTPSTLGLESWALNREPWTLDPEP